MAKITAQDIMTSNLGGFYINNTVAKTGRFRAFYVSSATVFTHLKVNGSNDDTKGDFIANSAVAVDAGVLIVAKPGTYFSSIQLASGAGWAINEYSQ